MSITLGFQPIGVVVALSRDGQFVTTLHNDDGPWPIGCTIKLQFSTDNPSSTSTVIEWDALIDEDDAVWSRGLDEVNAVLDGDHLAVRLYYSEGGSDPLLWGVGRVSAS